MANVLDKDHRLCVKIKHVLACEYQMVGDYYCMLKDNEGVNSKTRRK